ncbi:hypothetical protein CSUB01_11806 [Colletotrichum sublineola]|uniref:Uncharacterized protein n=1 Tax=Colletotrichum sublineola TaxID=1173701 RepID=A0A066X653_COLSU|nr:hypothetical protein CSUB01_11806 [Colletotrichum sublineola]
MASSSKSNQKGKGIATAADQQLPVYPYKILAKIWRYVREEYVDQVRPNNVDDLSYELETPPQKLVWLNGRNKIVDKVLKILSEDTTTTYDLPGADAKTDKKQAFGCKHMHDIMQHLVKKLEQTRRNMRKKDIKAAVAKGRVLEHDEPESGYDVNDYSGTNCLWVQNIRTYPSENHPKRHCSTCQTAENKHHGSIFPYLSVKAGLIHSVDGLPQRHKEEIICGIELGAGFNPGQLAQAENAPASPSILQEMKGHQTQFDFTLYNNYSISLA